MRRKAVLLTAALAAAALGAASAPAPRDAEARQTRAQQLFRELLLESRLVSRDVKTRLRKGGFVDRRIAFADLTGEGRDDAVVLVHSGGSAGRIALYVFSAGEGEELRIVYRNQRLFRASGRIAPAAEPGVLPTVVYRVPDYAAGDELCCPSTERETELRWSARHERFGVVARRTPERR